MGCEAAIIETELIIKQPSKSSNDFSKESIWSKSCTNYVKDII